MSDSLCPLGLYQPGSSVHGISQARILEWVAVSHSRGSSRCRDWICTSCLQVDYLPLSYQGSPSPLPRSCVACPFGQPQLSSVFVRTVKPPLTDASLSPRVHSVQWVHFQYYAFYGLGQIMMTYIHYYGITQTSFITLKIFCTVSAYLGFPSKSWQPLTFFTVSIVFAFSRMSYN